MTDDELKDFRKQPDLWLINILSGDKPTSPRHIAAKLEVQRRAVVVPQRLSIFAAIVSVLSLGVSIWNVLTGP